MVLEGPVDGTLYGTVWEGERHGSDISDQERESAPLTKLDDAMYLLLLEIPRVSAGWIEIKKEKGKKKEPSVYIILNSIYRRLPLFKHCTEAKLVCGLCFAEFMVRHLDKQSGSRYK